MVRRMIALAGAFALAGCSIAVDEGDVFRPRAKVESWDEAPHDGIAGERYFADAAGYPISDHGLAASVRHETVGGLQLSLVSLAEPPAATPPLIVHCFGNASDRWFAGLKYGRKLVPYGDVLLFDYPGYNGAPGAPTADAFATQTDDLSAYLQAEHGSRDRIYWGHSLGGFVCAELAARDGGAAGLVLETTAPDVRSAAASWIPRVAKPFVRLRIADSLLAYDTPRTAAATGLPILVIGAARDEVLKVELARALAERLEAAGAEPTYVEFAEAGHFDVGSQPGFDAAIRSFLADASGD